ncbi:acylphosphatase [Lactococcus nasutitermitis]|uniref:acylphosphatase n=1 Tax=Lactococcus nasutitermitis TaxID=1652957 RepID=A0ABV9JA92_9LACT|nr:acylphosphatase [Lactococcus nasutitermitis]
MQKLKIIVSGRVQGVGFRYFVISVAREHSIFGRVWNNDDGTVGIWAQSENSAEMTAFLASVRQGPKRSPFAKVDYLDSLPAAFPDFTDFNITYDTH